jgi:hypothetical protein
MLSGIKLYAAIGLLVLIAGLGLTAWGFKNKAEAAQARLEQVTSERDRAIAAARDLEATNETLRLAAKILDDQLVAIRKREVELNAQKRALQTKLDAIARTLSEADQACLSRDLPDALAERLRNGSGDRHEDGKAASPPSAPSPVR